MNHYRSLSHTAWDCKYHLIWIPKYRKKVLFGDLRKYLGNVFRKLALQKESKVLEGHLMGDHVHMLVSIPPKYAVSQVVGYIKEKVLFILQERMLGIGTILLARIFGQEVISYQQLVEMRKPSVSTSKDRKRQTKKSTN